MKNNKKEKENNLHKSKQVNDDFSLTFNDEKNDEISEQNSSEISKNTSKTSIKSKNETSEKNKLKEINKVEDYEEKPHGRKYFIGLLITFIVEGILVGLIYIYNYYVNNLGTTGFDKSFYSNLSTSFFVPGILGVLVYLINYVSKEGAFDALSYSIKLVFYSIFYSDVRKTKLANSYREYREEKRGKKRASTTYLLFGSLIYILLSIIFYVVFYFN